MQRVNRVRLLFKTKSAVQIHFFRKLGEMEHGLGAEDIKITVSSAEHDNETRQ